MTVCTICVPKEKPRLFLNSNLKGHWPVGGEAIVIAYTVEQAVTLLQAQIELEGLPQQTVKAEHFEEVECATPRAVIVNNGDY